MQSCLAQGLRQINRARHARQLIVQPMMRYFVDRRTSCAPHLWLGLCGMSAARGRPLWSRWAPVLRRAAERSGVTTWDWQQLGRSAENVSVHARGGNWSAAVGASAPGGRRSRPEGQKIAIQPAISPFLSAASACSNHSGKLDVGDILPPCCSRGDVGEAPRSIGPRRWFLHAKLGQARRPSWSFSVSSSQLKTTSSLKDNSPDWQWFSAPSAAVNA